MAGTTAEAKIRLGLKGGLNFASLHTDASSVHDVYNSRTGWHAGAMMNVGLVAGLSLQPEILYSSKGADGASIGYLEIPVDLQWGISIPLPLVKLRPYVSLTPYASYRVSSGNDMAELNNWDGGIGLGAGLDVWKLQVALKYMWGFGSVTDINAGSKVQNRNVMLSLGFFL